eukprot:9503877-Pyramimonas_sp.AAC.1
MVAVWRHAPGEAMPHVRGISHLSVAPQNRMLEPSADRPGLPGGLATLLSKADIQEAAPIPTIERRIISTVGADGRELKFKEALRSVSQHGSYLSGLPASPVQHQPKYTKTGLHPCPYELNIMIGTPCFHIAKQPLFDNIQDTGELRKQAAGIQNRT